MKCDYTGECEYACSGHCLLAQREQWNTNGAPPSGIDFVVPGIPMTKRRAEIAAPRSKGKKTSGKRWIKKHETTVRNERNFLLLASPFLPPEPLLCPIEVSFTFVFPVPESWPAWRREAAIGLRYLHDVKPDVDNLTKLAMDALNKQLWKDDCQVVAVKACKIYGEHPRTMVHVTPFVQAAS